MIRSTTREPYLLGNVFRSSPKTTLFASSKITGTTSEVARKHFFSRKIPFDRPLHRKLKGIFAGIGITVLPSALTWFNCQKKENDPPFNFDNMLQENLELKKIYNFPYNSIDKEWEGLKSASPLSSEELKKHLEYILCHLFNIRKKGIEYVFFSMFKDHDPYEHGHTREEAQSFMWVGLMTLLAKLCISAELHKEFDAVETKKIFVDCLKEMQKCGLDVNASPVWGNLKPLHNSARDDCSTLCQALVEVGANLEGTESIYIGKTPLHIAAENGSVKAIITLLELGAQVSAKTSQNNIGNFETPLMRGVYYPDVISVLVEHGAEINATSSNNVFGPTAVHKAAKTGRYRSLEILFELGAEPGTLVLNELRKEIFRCIGFHLYSGASPENPKCWMRVAEVLVNTVNTLHVLNYKADNLIEKLRLEPFEREDLTETFCFSTVQELEKQLKDLVTIARYSINDYDQEAAAKKIHREADLLIYQIKSAIKKHLEMERGKQDVSIPIKKEKIFEPSEALEITID